MSSLLKGLGGLALALVLTAPATGAEVNLAISQKHRVIDGRSTDAKVINGQLPGPTLHFQEGEDVTINVTNRLNEPTSLHWHGLIVPNSEDGVPGLTYDGIAPGQTYQYHFRIRQSGTYWYHSHSGLQEQSGVYGAIVIRPTQPEVEATERDYTLVLSDLADAPADEVLANLKRNPEYYKFYNSERPTLVNFVRQWWDADPRTRQQLMDRKWMGARMRMDLTDIADVAHYTHLLNGKGSKAPWRGQFRPGERVRLRLINASADTYYDVRIPGIRMTVVEADGQPVRPETVDRLRIAIAETYDVVIQLPDDKPRAIFAEAADRTGYALGVLAMNNQAMPPIPPMDPPLYPAQSSHGGMAMPAMDDGMAPHQQPMGNMATAAPQPMPAMTMTPHQHAADAAASMPMTSAGQSGADRADPAPRVLTYDDLQSLKPHDDAPPAREIVLRLTGDMNRYMWSFNGVKYSAAKPLPLNFGERVRIRFINQTMMDHPIHLHGLWQELQNGHGRHNPLKHTLNIAPGEERVVVVNADNKGRWALHCHILYHANTGMFREVQVN